MIEKAPWIGPLPSFDITHLADQRVVCAAQRNSKNGTVVVGARHFDLVMRATIELLDPNNEQEWCRSDSGFIDQFGTFLTRQEAWIIANRQDQIICRCGGDDGCLYSENLY